MVAPVIGRWLAAVAGGLLVLTVWGSVRGLASLAGGALWGELRRDQ
jgi:hypothetical protein